MKIEELKISNFKAFKEVEMKNIPNFCVIVGANGVGKTTLLNVFGFLKEAMATNVQMALVKYGGSRAFEEVISRGCDKEKDKIEIRIKFRAQNKGIGQANPLITYQLSIGDDKGQAYVNKEILQYRRGSRGAPWKFLDFSKGKGQAVINEFDDVEDQTQLEREEQTLKSKDVLAIRGLSVFQKYPALVALGNLIESWHVSDIHIRDIRQEQQAGMATQLSTGGENLSLVIDHLAKRNREVLDKIIMKLKNRVPGVSQVESKIIETGQVLLKIQDTTFDEPFLVRYVSDGTIKMLAYLVLLLDPNPRPLLCVEEPENQLYPTLLEELAEEFRDYARKGQQVFISTHSPDFLNAMRLDEVFMLVKKDGYTQVKRASDDEQIKSYMERGDKMGYLWKQGFFTEVDPQ